MRKIVNSRGSLSDAIGLLRKTFEEKKFFTFIIKTGKARSIPQNSISHAWYLQVSLEEREFTPEEVKCLCKYHFGLPILRGDIDLEVEVGGEMVNYNEVCEQVIDPLPYENRIKAMLYFPVTSKMKTKQLNFYLECVQRHYAKRVQLMFPEDHEKTSK